MRTVLHACHTYRTMPRPCYSSAVRRSYIVSWSTLVIWRWWHHTPSHLCTSYRRVSLLTSPTEDQSKLLACLHGLRPDGGSSIVSGIKTAMVRLRLAASCPSAADDPHTPRHVLALVATFHRVDRVKTPKEQARWSAHHSVCRLASHGDRR